MPNFTSKTYTSVYDIPNCTFQRLDCEDSFYFSKPFLGSFEKAQKKINFQYLVFYKKGAPVALSIVQSLGATLGFATENVSFTQKWAQWILYYFTNRKAHILVCGNIFLSGEYGLYIKQGVNRRDVYEALSRKLENHKLTKNAKVIFFKDYNNTQLPAASILENEHYHPFAVEPNMRLNILWKTFNEYKDNLKSKYRIKVKKTDSRSHNLEVKLLSAQEVRLYLDDLTLLYTNVRDKSLLTTADINIETYALLKEQFDEQVFIQTYLKEGKIVGFLTAFHHRDILKAHFIGIDYTFNKTDAIYPRILNDYVRLGIKLGVKEINLGRTASEIKSTLGATPEHLRCYVKHKKTAINFLLTPVVGQIKMKEFKQHNPFKKL